MNGPSSLTIGRASSSIPAAVLDPGGPRTLEEMQHRARERRARARAQYSEFIAVQIQEAVQEPVRRAERRAPNLSAELAMSRPDLDMASFHAAAVVAARAFRKTQVGKVHQIQEAVAEHFGISRIDILSSRRTRNVVRPRQIAMYLVKELTPHSFPEIGRRFNRDHSTVLHAVRKIEALLPFDPALRADVEAIKEALAG